MTMRWSAPGAGDAPTSSDLQALLTDASSGREGAVSAVYDAVSARLYGLVLLVVGDPGESEQVAREAFVEIQRTAGTLRHTEIDAVSWMMTIAHRRAVERVRSRRQRGSGRPA